MKYLTALAITLIAAVGGYIGTAEKSTDVEPVVSAAIQTIGGVTYTLSGSGVSSSATSITLSSLTLPQSGYALQDSDLGDTFYITLEPGNRTRQEFASCTTVVQNANGSATLSGCSRGLAPISPYTASTTYAFAHAGGTQVIFSNPPQLYEQTIFKDNNATSTGIHRWASTTPPGYDQDPASGSWTAFASRIFASKGYVDSVAVAGASNANESTKGIVELATATEQASSTPTGSTGARLGLYSLYSTSTPVTGCSGSTRGALCVPVAQNDGTIHPFFIATSTSYTYRWDAIHVFGTTTTFNSAVKTTECTLTDGATITFNANNCTQGRVVLGGNRTLTITNESVGQTMRLVACSDSSARSITTWDSNVLWPGGTTTPPTATATANRCDIYSFVTSAATGTTIIFGSIVPF